MGAKWTPRAQFVAWVEFNFSLFFLIFSNYIVPSLSGKSKAVAGNENEYGDCDRQLRRTQIKIVQLCLPSVSDACGRGDGVKTRGGGVSKKMESEDGSSP